MFRKLVILSATIAPALLGAQQTTDPAARPIPLQEAIRLARENNVAAVTAENAVRSANLQIRSTKAQLFPQVTASMGANKSAGQKLDVTTNSLRATAAPWAYSNGITLNQTLFDGGKTFADLRAQRASITSAQANEVAQDFNISLNVKTQYNNILAAEEAEAAARAQLAYAAQQLNITVAKVNAGAANVADSLNAVVSVGNAQIAILTAQQNLRSANAALTRAVGTSYVVTALPTDTTEVQHPLPDSAQLMSWALEGPSVRQFEAQLSLANAQERSQRTAYFPTISLNASYSGNGSNNPYGFGGSPQYPFLYNRSIGLNLSYPIFNRWQRENGIVNAQINADNALAQIKDQKLAAEQTIVTQLGVLRNDEAKIAVQLVQIRAAQEAIRVDQQRYELGAGLLVTVLQDQQNLVVARQNLIATRLDLRNARAAIEAFIGRDLP